ncbi:molybdopterin-dependent oxidoreductase [Chitinophaga arvensicola]|uniref:Oxidoreductase molybdopterin binding domain-containing protein n=1 Tax=Chitinophaga arvensicola TaxID=29529 RepID=A0A1I0R522_9BACT|nr:molybdopterin-dependent oxidoreductase [Chitinophaga arvensicola]SEW35427.1 Oxidoreductase molybdopterin binding domain-containing protein [Chitinophaga arvensicola]
MLYKLAAGLLISAFMATTAFGQTISVEGEVTTPLKLSVADIAKMKKTEVTAADRDGKTHRYSGVPVTDILQQAGVTLGAQLRGENMAKYLLVKSGDGYEVLFSLAELDAAFTDRVVILADQVDGKPLPDGKGPFRIVVPGEKKPARWIWEVTTMTVRFAKD